MARLFRLNLGKTFRQLAKAEQADWASAILAASPPKLRSDGSPIGGSLSSEVLRANLARIRRWGYVLKLYQLGGKGHLLTFLIRGATRRTGAAKGGDRGRFVKGTQVQRLNVQRARPINVQDPTSRIEVETKKAVMAQFAAWDRKAKP